MLDTNVLSELRKGSRAQAGVVEWTRSVDSAQLFLSAVTIHELEVGVLSMERRDPAQGARLRNWMNAHVMTAFADRVLSVDAAVMLRSAQFHVPNPHSLRDGFIAATALVHNMVVVTRNVGDFARTGARLLNPWEPQA